MALLGAYLLAQDSHPQLTPWEVGESGFEYRQSGCIDPSWLNHLTYVFIWKMGMIVTTHLSKLRKLVS